MKSLRERRVAKKVLEYVNVSIDLHDKGKIDFEELERRLEMAHPYIEENKKVVTS